MIPKNLNSAQAELFQKLARTEQPIDQMEYARLYSHKYREQSQKKRPIEEEEDDGGFDETFEDMFSRFRNPWGR